MKPLNTPKDFLTNCYTREGILPFLKRMEEEYLVYKRPFSVLIMDVDHFKTFNDRYGHLLGDEVLKYFSSSMRLDLEDEENAPFRFGGDEFIMVFPSKTADEAYQLAQRLRKNIRARPCLIKGKQINVTFSGGIAGYPQDAGSVEDILDRADKALYSSKNHGRARVTKYSDLDRKELFQTAGIVLVLAAIGWVLFTYRDALAEKFGEAELALRRSPWVSQLLNPKPIEPEPPAAVEPPPAPEPPQSELPKDEPAAAPEPPKAERIVLESGRVVTGRILNEDAESYTVEIALNEGRGALRVKKSQVVRIES